MTPTSEGGPIAIKLAGIMSWVYTLLLSSVHNHHGMRSAVECTCCMQPPMVPLEQLPWCFCPLRLVFSKHGLLFQAELARWCGIQVFLLCWDACTVSMYDNYNLGKSMLISQNLASIKLILLRLQLTMFANPKGFELWLLLSGGDHHQIGSHLIAISY